MSRVLKEPGQKSTRIEICKKISTQPDPNPWWAGLARGFQPILIALIKNQCLHHVHHQYMMNCFQESINIVQENMINITHFLSCYSTKYKWKNYTFLSF